MFIGYKVDTDVEIDVKPLSIWIFGMCFALHVLKVHLCSSSNVFHSNKVSTKVPMDVIM